MDIVEQMRSFESDHEPDGWPAIQMKQVSALCDEFERLQSLLNGMASEVERLQSLLEQERQESLTVSCRVAALEMELDSANPIPAQQSPAVAVPAKTETIAKELSHASVYLYSYVEQLEYLLSTSSPRITEQDAIDVIEDYVYWQQNLAFRDSSPQQWCKEESGCELLTKLNEAKHD